MQIFVSCPFCGRVFDAMSEPHVKLRLDGINRVAHLACVPAAPAVPTIKPTKPNGDAGPIEGVTDGQHF